MTDQPTQPQEARADRLRAALEKARSIMRENGPFTTEQMYFLGERFEGVIVTALQNDRPDRPQEQPLVSETLRAIEQWCAQQANDEAAIARGQGARLTDTDSVAINARISGFRSAQEHVAELRRLAHSTTAPGEGLTVTEDLFRKAMFDPGRFVKRVKVKKPGERPSEAEYESLIEWQWRALKAATEKPETSTEETG